MCLQKSHEIKTTLQKLACNKKSKNYHGWHCITISLNKLLKKFIQILKKANVCNPPTQYGKDNFVKKSHAIKTTLQKLACDKKLKKCD